VIAVFIKKELKKKKTYSKMLLEKSWKFIGQKLWEPFKILL